MTTVTKFAVKCIDGTYYAGHSSWTYRLEEAKLFSRTNEATAIVNRCRIGAKAILVTVSFTEEED